MNNPVEHINSCLFHERLRGCIPDSWLGMVVANWGVGITVLVVIVEGEGETIDEIEEVDIVGAIERQFDAHNTELLKSKGLRVVFY